MNVNVTFFYDYHVQIIYYENICKLTFFTSFFKYFTSI